MIEEITSQGQSILNIYVLENREKLTIFLFRFRIFDEKLLIVKHLIF